VRRDFAHSAIECAARHPTELENTCTDLRQALDRSDLLEAVSTAWSKLDPDEYPFARSVAGQIRITMTGWIFSPDRSNPQRY